jgi:carbamoylphosphate synthase large subunit
MAVTIARLQGELLAAGWKLLTCDHNLVSRLSNKVSLREHAEALGLLNFLPRHYSSPQASRYPCILKTAEGEHGKNVHIVRSIQDALDVTTTGFGSEWLLQELIPGCEEYACSVLVDNGEVLDAICTRYEYDREEYVWPFAEEVSRTCVEPIPSKHLQIMRGFLRGYSGICNFNYKVREDGTLCIFEINTRVGSDLACDVPRPRARALFERLDALCVGDPKKP